MNKLDRHIIFRLFSITFFILLVLVIIFILMDFSENSDDFTDQGATLAQIWNEYYLNYIPEMIRLVSPIALLIACLFLTGQMTERLEIVALKAAGVSLYRLAAPYILFGFALAFLISYLDAYIIPKSNAERIAFEKQYLSQRTDRIDRGGLYRQESPNTIFTIDHYDPSSDIGYRATLVEFDGDNITRIIRANRIQWIDSTEVWEMSSFHERIFTDYGYEDEFEREKEYVLNIFPRDLSRRTSDIYQLTYQEAVSYISSIRRIGAGEINLPLVQLYSRVAYPVSIIVMCLIGFAIAAEQRKGGKGFYIAMGLVVTFVYMAFMEIIRPFGTAGTIEPLTAVLLPHVIFLIIGIVLLLITKK